MEIIQFVKINNSNSIKKMLGILLVGVILFSIPNMASGSQSIVNTKRNIYSYYQMQLDIAALQARYPQLINSEVIGKSAQGRNIYAVKIGKGPKEIFINGSHHAREWIATLLIMKTIEEYATAYQNNGKVGLYYARGILDKTTIWFVPMVNPDGVTLQQFGNSSSTPEARKINASRGLKSFSRWKANIRGVDLNKQYPADWKVLKSPSSPSPQNFKGYAPLSEKEVQAVVYFTKKHDFRLAIAYHSAGEIIYWDYKQKGAQLARDRKIANQFAAITKYKLVPHQNNPSGGGFKDWFITEKKLPGFTIEVGTTSGIQVPVGQFALIWEKNKTIGLVAALLAPNPALPMTSSVSPQPTVNGKLRPFVPHTTVAF